MQCKKSGFMRAHLVFAIARHHNSVIIARCGAHVAGSQSEARNAQNHVSRSNSVLARGFI